MACPFFFPTEKSFSIAWSFPQRLPLGAGFCGRCRANGVDTVPDDATLRDFCNLGHAATCSRLPAARHADSVRFVVAADADDKILLDYVYDRNHAPAGHGRLEYNCRARSWTPRLADACVQRQAECYLATYLERRQGASLAP